MGNVEVRGTKCIFGCDDEYEDIDFYTEVPVALFNELILAAGRAKGRAQHREIRLPSGRRTLRRTDLPVVLPHEGVPALQTQEAPDADKESEYAWDSQSTEASLSSRSSFATKSSHSSGSLSTYFASEGRWAEPLDL